MNPLAPGSVYILLAVLLAPAHAASPAAATAQRCKKLAEQVTHDPLADLTLTEQRDLTLHFVLAEFATAKTQEQADWVISDAGRRIGGALGILPDRFYGEGAFAKDAPLESQQIFTSRQDALNALLAAAPAELADANTLTKAQRALQSGINVIELEKLAIDDQRLWALDLVIDAVKVHIATSVRGRIPRFRWGHYRDALGFSPSKLFGEREYALPKRRAGRLFESRVLAIEACIERMNQRQDIQDADLRSTIAKILRLEPQAQNFNDLPLPAQQVSIANAIIDATVDLGRVPANHPKNLEIASWLPANTDRCFGRGLYANEQSAHHLRIFDNWKAALAFAAVHIDSRADVPNALKTQAKEQMLAQTSKVRAVTTVPRKGKRQNAQATAAHRALDFMIPKGTLPFWRLTPEQFEQTFGMSLKKFWGHMRASYKGATIFDNPAHGLTELINLLPQRTDIPKWRRRELKQLFLSSMALYKANVPPHSNRHITEPERAIQRDLANKKVVEAILQLGRMPDMSQQPGTLASEFGDLVGIMPARFMGNYYYEPSGIHAHARLNDSPELTFKNAIRYTKNTNNFTPEQKTFAIEVLRQAYLTEVAPAHRVIDAQRMKAADNIITQMTLGNSLLTPTNMSQVNVEMVLGHTLRLPVGPRQHTEPHNRAVLFRGWNHFLDNLQTRLRQRTDLNPTLRDSLLKRVLPLRHAPKRAKIDAQPPKRTPPKSRTYPDPNPKWSHEAQREKAIERFVVFLILKSRLPSDKLSKTGVSEIERQTGWAAEQIYGLGDFAQGASLADKQFFASPAEAWKAALENLAARSTRPETRVIVNKILSDAIRDADSAPSQTP